MLKRQAVESIERQKVEMIAAIYANANYGSEDITKAVEGLEKHFKEAIEAVYLPPSQRKRHKEGKEPDWNNPFWAGAKRSYDRQATALAELRGTTREMTVKEVMDHEARRDKRLNHLDQYGKTRGE